MRPRLFSSEPLCDYANPDNLHAAHQAVAEVRSRLGASHPARIGATAYMECPQLISYAPARPDLVVGVTASCGVAQVDQAIEAARQAYASWSLTSPEARAEVLFRLATLLRERRFEWLALLAFEIGKDWYEADAEIAEAIDFCEYYGRLALTHFQYQPLARLAGEDNTYTYIPLGVGAVIAPWNFPLAILAGMTMAAVVSGNAVVVKPSSHAPIIAARLWELAQEAGLPDGVFNLVPGNGSDIGDHLVAHPHVRFVAFTGSADVGLHINEIIAKPDPRRLWITRYVSEMGGKNAIIVDETADLDAASSAVVRSAFGFQGQKCSAASRIIVDRRVKAELLERVIAKTRTLPVADPWEDCCVFIGPVISQRARGRLLEAIARGKAEAKLVLGGKALERDGHFLEPTIFDDARPDSFLGQDELFGPVTAFFPTDCFEEALSIANGTPYGLTGAVFSQDSARLEQAKLAFHVGNLYINRGTTGALVGIHPFGGFNLSGTDSKAGGPDYLFHFTQGKSTSARVTVHRMPGVGA